MDLLLIRHAQPFHLSDPAGADPSLTPEGERQAKRLARALADGRYGQVQRLVSSPMRRAAQTAAFAAASLSLDTVVDDRLAELDRGWTTYGLDLDAYTERKLLWQDMNAGRLGVNEFDVAAFRSRVLAGIDASVDHVGGSTTAVVCHGGVINAVLSHIVGAAQMFFTEPFYTSVSRVRVEPDGYREMLSLNETHHLWD
jgi:probable phosphoglycerate mutase